jgi:hypothetical protein
MGYVAIPLGGMEFGKDAWYPLENRPGKEHKKKKQRGDIHIFTKVVRHNTLSQVRGGCPLFHTNPTGFCDISHTDI